MSKKLKANILLLITAAAWGASFVSQVSGMDYVVSDYFPGHSSDVCSSGSGASRFRDEQRQTVRCLHRKRKKKTRTF